MTPEQEMKIIEEKMRPGKMSVHGFLGMDERLLNVMEEDEKTLMKHKLTFEQVATCLDNFINIYHQQTHVFKSGGFSLKEGINQGNITIVPINEKISMSASYWSGSQFCPFFEKKSLVPLKSLELPKECPVAENSDYMIYNFETKMKLGFSGLHPHLIKEHHFFEGKGTRYRVDPEKLICVLGLNHILPFTEIFNTDNATMLKILDRYTYRLKWTRKCTKSIFEK